MNIFIVFINGIYLFSVNIGFNLILGMIFILRIIIRKNLVFVVS